MAAVERAALLFGAKNSPSGLGLVSLNTTGESSNIEWCQVALTSKSWAK